MCGCVTGGGQTVGARTDGFASFCNGNDSVAAGTHDSFCFNGSDAERRPCCLFPFVVWGAEMRFRRRGSEGWQRSFFRSSVFVLRSKIVFLSRYPVPVQDVVSHGGTMRRFPRSGRRRTERCAGNARRGCDNIPSLRILNIWVVKPVKECPNSEKRGAGTGYGTRRRRGGCSRGASTVFWR